MSRCVGVIRRSPAIEGDVRRVLFLARAKPDFIPA